MTCRSATNVTLEEEDAAGWTPAWSPILDACLGPPIIIPPGQASADTLEIWGAQPGKDVEPAFSSKRIDRVFPLVWQSIAYHYDTRGRGFGGTVPVDLRYSNAFRLSQAR